MKGSFEIKVNGEWCRVEGESVTTTLLEWLRVQGLTGAKEGCDDMRCGACTVALADRDAEGKCVYRAIPACGIYLPMLAGREIVTVEAVAHGDQLGAVQRAIADAGGSRCGYCTPGIVMSMFEGVRREDLETNWQVNEQLCGNLCRCTGYRAIREAAVVAFQAEGGDGGEDPGGNGNGGGDADEGRFGELQYIDRRDDRFYRPESLEEVLLMLKEYPGATLVAGGTSMVGGARPGAGRIDCMISLEGVEMRGISQRGDDDEVGAMTTLTGFVQMSTGRRLPVQTMARSGGARQLRNRATVGGAIVASPVCGDLGVILLAYDATVRAVSLEGERGIALHQLFKGGRRLTLRDGEVIRSVRIPRHEKGGEGRGGAGPVRFAQFYKVTPGGSADARGISACFAVSLDDGKIASVRLAYAGIGGGGVAPARAKDTEETLKGREWAKVMETGVLDVLATEFDLYGESAGSVEYRKALVVNLFCKFCHEFRKGHEKPEPLGRGAECSNPDAALGSEAAGQRNQSSGA